MGVVCCALAGEMVLIHVKKAEKNEWLFETTSATSVEVVTKELCRIHNLRGRVNRLTEAATELAKHGPMKTPEEQGLDDDTPLLSDMQEDGTMKAKSKPSQGPNYNPDPSNRRNGDAPSAELQTVIQRTVDDAKVLTSMQMVESKKTLTAKMLTDAIDSIRGAVMICYPMGLPEWDLVKQTLEEPDDGLGADDLDPEVAVLWWANKELQREKTMAEYVGRNEKTKIIGKLQKAGSTAPMREPLVTKEEQQEMIAYYHKKEQEMKKLAAEDEDAYLNSAWANPKNLKNSFTGVGDISWKPK